MGLCTKHLKSSCFREMLEGVLFMSYILSPAFKILGTCIIKVLKKKQQEQKSLNGKSY